MSPARSSTRYLFPLALVALGAVALAIRFDLGRRYGFEHVDEPIVAALMQRAAVGPVSADWAGLPLEQWNHPTLQFSPWTLPMQWLGRLAGIVPGEEERAIRLARGMSALFAGLTVIVVGLAARLLGRSEGAGLFAAAVLALAPLHVQDGIYARPEAMLALAVSAALLAGIRLLGPVERSEREAISESAASAEAGDRRTPAWVAGRLGAAAFASGLAVSIKVNAASLAFWPLLVGLVAGGRLPRPAAIAIVAAGGAAGFLVGTPEFLVAPSVYFKGLAYEARHYLSTGHRPHEAFDASDPNALWFLDYLGRLGFGPVPTVVACWFLVRALVRGERGERSFAAWLLGATVICVLPRVRFERNLEVILPGLAIAAGPPLARLLDQTRAAFRPRFDSVTARAPLAAALVALALGPSALTVWRLSDQIDHPMAVPPEFPAETEGYFHVHALVLADGWPMEASRAYIIHDPGDRFSRARLPTLPAIPGGGRRIIVESRWRAYNYPFSTIDFYHGPRRYIILVPDRPLSTPVEPVPGGTPGRRR